MATTEQTLRISRLDYSDCATDIDDSEELLAMCAKQDQVALRELYLRFERPVYSMLLRTLNNPQDAEEALSDVFLKVWKYAGQFKGKSKFSTWLYSITTNTARDYLRSKASKRKVQMQSLERYDGTTLEMPAPRNSDPEEIVVSSSERQYILDALQALSADDRLMLVLYHFQELSYDEICNIMKLSPENLKVRLYRARQRLKKLCLRAEED